MSEIKPNYFCTYFDSKYLHRGIALYYSIAQHSREPFKLWILCFDKITEEVLNKLHLPNVEIIPLADFEKDDAPLQKAKKNRSRVEYYWTCTPSLLLYIFRKYSEISLLTYVDADMYFFNNPSIALKELGEGSILILPHDYSEEYKDNMRAGKYNVGLVVFRADENGRSCLERWRKQCLEWCHIRHENGQFGDQGYLNDWPERFKGVVVPNAPQLCAGPWNISKYQVSFDTQKKVLINNKALICYHFHAMRFCNRYLIFLAPWNIKLSKICISYIYKPYVKFLLDIQKDLLARGFKVSLPKCGIMWRYIIGRILKLQPLRYFMICR